MSTGSMFTVFRDKNYALENDFDQENYVARVKMHASLASYIMEKGG